MTSGSKYSPQLYTFKVSLPYLAMASSGEEEPTPPFKATNTEPMTNVKHTAMIPKTLLEIGLPCF